MRTALAICIAILFSVGGYCVGYGFMTGQSPKEVLLSFLPTRSAPPPVLVQPAAPTPTETPTAVAAAPETPAPTPQAAASAPAPPARTLAEARKTFATRIDLGHLDPGPAPKPPHGSGLTMVRYKSPVGMLPAYLSAAPKDKNKHPAIIWITGGDANSIGDVWSPQPFSNDQSAAAFRKAGIVTLYPSLRGGNDNPGHTEGFYGEIDDILAAADYLAKVPYVDPNRIYLGGHSTGGVMVFLVAETTDRFRAVFSFGGRVRGTDSPTFFKSVDLSKYPRDEVLLRAPGEWMASVRSPLFAIEGDGFNSNAADLDYLRLHSDNPNIHFLTVSGADHFTVLAPSTRVIVQKILADSGPASAISLGKEELEAALRKP